MTSFTWISNSGAEFVGWNTPADWSPYGTPNAATDDVTIPYVIGPGGQPWNSEIFIGGSENYVLHSLTLGQSLFDDGTLALEGGLTLQHGFGILLTHGTLAFSSLSEAGTSGLAGTGLIESAGSIDNVATIIGYGGLTLDVAQLRNDGLLDANIGTLVVDVAATPGAFLSFAGGTLEGGTCEADGGATLDLNIGAAVTADAADIVLVGSPYFGETTVLETNGGPGGAPASLANTLRTITAGGTLSLTNMAYSDSNPLVDLGLVRLQGGTLATAGLTVGTGGTLIGQGTLAGPVSDNGVVAVNGGMLLINANVSGSGALEIGVAASGGAAPAGETLDLAGAAGSLVAFEDRAGVLDLLDPAAFGGTISGFGSGEVSAQGAAAAPVSDEVILQGTSLGAVESKTYSGTISAGTLTLGTAAGSMALRFLGDYTTSDFVLAAGPDAPSGAPTILISDDPPCFAAGTRLRTARGDVAVEDLVAGDVASTASGAARAIRWIGHRRVECVRHPAPWDVWPVCIAADAFGRGVPRRDLHLSPDHAVLIDGVLIPVRYLINDATIVQEPRDSVTYFHVELDSHDILLAEDLPCESYLDTGNRGAFANGGEPIHFHPQFALGRWQTRACADLVREGAELQAARSHLLERAGLLGYATTRDPSLRVVSNGRSLKPVRTGSSARFVLPPDAGTIRLVSRNSIPAHLHDASDDHRRLGVAVAALRMDGRRVALTDPCFGAGWHGHEAAPGGGWRWTDGDAAIAANGCRSLEIEIAMTELYWLDAAEAQALASLRGASRAGL